MVHGVLVRRPSVASLTWRRGDLTSETQYSEEEEPKPIWAFAQLRRLGFGLLHVGPLAHGDSGLTAVPSVLVQSRGELQRLRGSNNAFKSFESSPDQGSALSHRFHGRGHLCHYNLFGWRFAFFGLHPIIAALGPAITAHQPSPYRRRLHGL